MQAKCMLHKRIIRNLIGWSLCSFAWISSVGAQKAADQVEVVPLLSAAEQAAADEFLAKHEKNAIGQYLWENRRDMRNELVRRHVTYFHARGADIEANPNNVGNTPLHWATISNGGVEIVKLLVSLGAKVNARNNNRFTPLHFAAGKDSDGETVRFLVSQGADVDAKSRYGDTPLIYLMRWRDKGSKKALKSPGSSWTTERMSTRMTPTD